jgi:hypothetical protein
VQVSGFIFCGFTTPHANKRLISVHGRAGPRLGAMSTSLMPRYTSLSCFLRCLYVYVRIFRILKNSTSKSSVNLLKLDFGAL